MLDLMPKKTPEPSELPNVVRIPAAVRERLQAVAVAMSKRALTDLPAAVVIREALDRGLADLESELGIKRGK